MDAVEYVARQVERVDPEAAAFLRRRKKYEISDNNPKKLVDLMEWKDTPQGYNYWERIHIKIQDRDINGKELDAIFQSEHKVNIPKRVFPKVDIDFKIPIHPFNFPNPRFPAFPSHDDIIDEMKKLLAAQLRDSLHNAESNKKLLLLEDVE